VPYEISWLCGIRSYERFRRMGIMEVVTTKFERVIGTRYKEKMRAARHMALCLSLDRLRLRSGRIVIENSKKYSSTC
jgi:hypothetical protein